MYDLLTSDTNSKKGTKKQDILELVCFRTQPYIIHSTMEVRFSNEESI